MIWKVSRPAPEDIDLFTRKYGTNRLTSALLLARNIVEPEQLKYFLNDDLRFLHNPFLFSHMNTAIGRIKVAISENEYVLVYGDRDADGITATVLLVSALRDEGLTVFWEVPMGDDPYSLQNSIVEKYAEKGVTLIITVDCGITNVQEISHARTSGIDCIVIDHHNQGEELPEAAAIIDPKCSFDRYPFEGLSAVALVLKLLTALDISRSDFYNQPMCFLNLRPGNESIIIEAVKLFNLVEEARISETIVPGSGKHQLDRIIDFIKDQPIIVYQQDIQMKLLSEVFGNSFEFMMTDITEEIWTAFPALRGKSLLRMLEGSKLNKFSAKPMQEIDAAVQLLTSYFYAKNPFILENMKARLDITALGLIADMMPLFDENRIIIRHGLRLLEKTPRKGLRELMARLNVLGSPLTSTTVSWKLTPAINATGRMGQPDLTITLLLEEGNIVELAENIHQLNEKRKQLGNTAWEFSLPEAKTSLENYEGLLICVSHESISRGITGILAGRLSRQFNVPAIVLAIVDDSYVASVRSARNFHVTDFLAQFSHIFDDFGGHDAAGGFRFQKDRYDQFLSELKSRAALIELGGESEIVLNVDMELRASEIGEELEKFQESMAPAGQGFRQIQYAVRKARIVDAKIIGKNAEHLKLLLAVGNQKWPAIYWSSADRFQRDFTANSVVDCVFTLERNYFANNSVLQLTILDIQNHEA